MAAFLTSGTTAAQSSDFTLVLGDRVTLFLIDADGADSVAMDAQVDIQIKSAGNSYFTIGKLTRAQPAYVLEAVGTFRLDRHAVSAAVGVDKN